MRAGQAGDFSFLTLPDGRRLAYAEYGNRHGAPLFYHHGMPGSRLELAALAAQCTEAGVYCIAPDRPGYGRSDPLTDRSLLQWTADLRCLAEHLGWGRFSLAGFSGGGPFALAAAYALADRVEQLMLFASLAPFDQQSDSAAMDPAVFGLYQAARSNPESLTEQLEASLTDETALYEAMIDGLADADCAIFTDAGLADCYRQNMAEARRQGLAEISREMALIASPWPFNPAEVTIPTRLWHGTDDSKAPPAWGQRLASQLACCEFIPLHGQGHFFAFRYWSDIVQGLTPL